MQPVSVLLTFRLQPAGPTEVNIDVANANIVSLRWLHAHLTHFSDWGSLILCLRKCFKNASHEWKSWNRAADDLDVAVWWFADAALTELLH